MPVRYYIGVDVAKETFHYTLLEQSKVLDSQSLPNTEKSIRSWISNLRKNYRLNKTNAVFCLEHTGLYIEFFTKILYKKGLKLWVESALRIKRSLGIQRGKNDAIDSRRIAQYAHLHRDHIKLWEPPRPEIQQLKHLSSLRQRLMKSLYRIQNCQREYKGFLEKKPFYSIDQLCIASITSIQVDIKRTEDEMFAIMLADEHLSHLYEIVSSVENVGEVLTMEIIIATNEFKKFESAKQFASYIGVAPFENMSGSSIGKSKISNMANKRVKAHLHMPAVASVARPGEMQDYYKRKVAEGHPKMSVINAICNKIIQRIFACVKEDRLFEKRTKTIINIS